MTDRFPTYEDVRTVWRARTFDYRSGRHYGFPLCCVLRFSFGRYLQMAARRGGRHKGPDSVYVPCGVFHRHSPDLPPWQHSKQTYREGHGGYAWIVEQYLRGNQP